MSIGNRLKKARKAHNMSQDMLAEKIGTSRGVITNIEHDKVDEPQPMVINTICDVLKLNKDWLLYGKGDMEIKTPSSTMEQLRKEFNLDDFSYNLAYEYLKLDDEQRKAVRDFFYRVIGSEDGIDYIAEAPKTSEELEEKYPPIDTDEHIG